MDLIRWDGIPAGEMKRTEKYGCFAIYRGTSYKIYWMVLIRVTKCFAMSPKDMGRVLKNAKNRNDTFLTACCGKFHLQSVKLCFMTINYLDPGKNLLSV